LKPNALVAVDRRDRALGAGDVERDLGRVHLEGEIDVELLEGLEDRAEALGEIGEAGIPIRLRGRREGVDRVPDGRAGEAVDDRGKVVLGAVAAGLGVEERARGLGRGDHLLGGPLAHALGVAVAPDVGRQDGLVALVDVVADRLADEVAGDGVAGQAVVLEERPLVVDVFLARGGGIDIEVVAPAGELDTIVAHLLDERGEFFEGEVGPLAGEQGDGTGHGCDGAGSVNRYRAVGGGAGGAVAAGV
jgi:hypothetical protein